jgi:hypothetical protein
MAGELGEAGETGQGGEAAEAGTTAMGGPTKGPLFSSPSGQDVAMDTTTCDEVFCFVCLWRMAGFESMSWTSTLSQSSPAGMGHLCWRSGQTGLLRRMATPQIFAARMHRLPLRMHAIAAWLRHGESTLK